MPEPEYLTIELTQGQVATVDAGDYERVAAYKWWAQYDPTIKGFYAKTQIKRASKDWPAFSMHRFIMGLESGDRRQVDHVNRNTLDNRKLNLRIATASENARNRGLSTKNTSGFKGVSWRKDRNRWIAQIRVHGKLTCIGSRKTKEEAYALYCEASKNVHGEFGSTE